MSEKIAKCPWCNEPAEITHLFSVRYLGCSNMQCLSIGPSCDTEEKALAEWNRVARTMQAVRRYRLAVAAVKRFRRQYDRERMHAAMQGMILQEKRIMGEQA